MCGFAGFIGYDYLANDKVAFVAHSMGDKIQHRGPDDSGVWFDNEAQVAIVHRRLAVVDLTIAGHQPMVSKSGRYVLAFNGEVYNHLELREKLRNLRDYESWRGGSDTETLLAAIDVWGLDTSLKYCTGMFAFALWDKQARSLYLVRDRMGEKPLYYGWQNGVFLFGSELKALRVHPAFIGEVDRDSIALQLRHSYIPAPYSIYKGIKKLPAGSVVKLAIGSGQTIGEYFPESVPYWSLSDEVMHGQAIPFQGGDLEALDEIEEILQNSAKQQMVADVPLGVFLSGGIDSSLIASLMQAQSTRPIKTFTIGFHESGYNEAHYAKSVAEYLGTDHTEIYVAPQQALDIIPRLPSVYDEPFSDSSQIATFLVSDITRQHVTVALSGDAGDELFGGYNRYLGTQSWWDRIERLPAWLRQGSAKRLMGVKPNTWDQIGEIISTVLGDRVYSNNLSSQVAKIAGVLTVDNGSDLYRHFVSHWKNPEQLVVDGKEPHTQFSCDQLYLGSVVKEMMVLDALSYLPDDILCKVDRAAMAVSLETRAPLLDHHVVEFAWRLPLSMKIRNGEGKWILRQLLYKYVPRNLLERPKMGFGIPIDSWLRGSMRDWAESLLDESRMRQAGFLNPVLIRQKWEEHLSGQRNWQYHLWDVLMFQAWLEENK